jgi:hypothetical protein
LEVNGQFHAQAALPLKREQLVPIGYEAGRTPELFLITWRRNNLTPARIQFPTPLLCSFLLVAIPTAQMLLPCLGKICKI